MGFVNSMEILDGGRISIAALAVGIARARLNRPCVIRRSDISLVNRFRSFRRSSLSWPTWRRADRRCETVDVSRVDEGQRQEDDEGVVDGEVVCFRRSASTFVKRRFRCTVDTGTQRLSAREVLARFEAVHDRRRHFRDPTTDHRASFKTSLIMPAETNSLSERVSRGEAAAVARAISKIEDGSKAPRR